VVLVSCVKDEPRSVHRESNFQDSTSAEPVLAEPTVCTSLAVVASDSAAESKLEALVATHRWGYGMSNVEVALSVDRLKRACISGGCGRRSCSGSSDKTEAAILRASKGSDLPVPRWARAFMAAASTTSKPDRLAAEAKWAP
jgi:hypothetical protein